MDQQCCAQEICCGKRPGETEEAWQARRAALLARLLELHAGNIHDAMVNLLSWATIVPKSFTPAIRATAEAAREHEHVNIQQLLEAYRPAVEEVVRLAREHPYHE